MYLKGVKRSYIAYFTPSSLIQLSSQSELPVSKNCGIIPEVSKAKGGVRCRIPGHIECINAMRNYNYGY
jgi:hypothetical protein